MTQSDPRRAEGEGPLPAPCDPSHTGDDIQVVAEDEPGVVRVEGELAADTVNGVRQCLHGLARQGGGRVVLDLADVRSIDWNGLGLLVGAREQVRREGGELVLRSLPADAARLLDASGTRGLFVIEG